MDREDWYAAIFIAGLVLMVVVMVVLGTSVPNEDTWDKQFNGCYVHTHYDNRLFGKDTATKDLYCPVRVGVQS